MTKLFLVAFVSMVGLFGYFVWRAEFAPARRAFESEQVQATFDNTSVYSRFTDSRPPTSAGNRNEHGNRALAPNHGRDQFRL